jgi:hypothetical protein
MVGFVGVTWMDTSAADVTDRILAGLVFAPRVAVMFVVPVLTAVAKPFVPVELDMDAVPGVPEFQVTDVVMSRVELSV